MSRKKRLTACERNDNNYAVAYYRYSSAGQRDVSIEQQREQCTRYAEDRGYKIVAEFEDRAKSGLTADRDGYKQMVAAVDKIRPAALICYKIDRLGRDMSELAQVEATLRKMGCWLETVREPFVDPSDPNSPLMRGVQFGMAEAYSRQIAGNIQRGVDDNSKKCLFNGHGVFGLTVDESRHYAIDPDTSPFVVKIFEDYAGGKQLKDIAEELNAMGVRTRPGNKWKIEGLRYILHNRAYLGEYHNGDYVNPNAFPALISDSLFDEVQRKFAKNKRLGSQAGRPDDAPRYWLTGKLYCGECGHAMSGMYGTSRTGQRYYYYRCMHKGCKKKPVRKNDIESQVLYVLKQVLKDPGSAASLAIDALSEYERSHPKTASMRDNLAAKQKEVEKKIANIVKTIEEGHAYDALFDRLRELEEQKNQIGNAIEIENLKLDMDDGEHTIRAYFDRFANSDLDDSTARDLVLEYFVDRIYVFDDYLRVLLSWSSTGNEEIEFWMEDGLPCWLWAEADEPVRMAGESSSKASGLGLPSRKRGCRNWQPLLLAGRAQRDYIFTGALTPRRFRLRASTMRVASQRARRAVCTAASSVSTWQLV